MTMTMPAAGTVMLLAGAAIWLVVAARNRQAVDAVTLALEVVQKQALQVAHLRSHPSTLSLIDQVRVHDASVEEHAHWQSYRALDSVADVGERAMAASATRRHLQAASADACTSLNTFDCEVVAGTMEVLTPENTAPLRIAIDESALHETCSDEHGCAEPYTTCFRVGDCALHLHVPVAPHTAATISLLWMLLCAYLPAARVPVELSSVANTTLPHSSVSCAASGQQRRNT